MLAQFYPPIIGGIEHHVRALSIELAARGHDVSVVTIRHADQSAYSLDHNVRIYRIRLALQHIPGLFHDSGLLHAPPFPDPQLLLELRRILRQECPQIVHVHNWLGRSYLPLKAWSHARLIVTLHDYSLVCAKQSLVYRERLCAGPGKLCCLGCAARHYGPLRGITTALSNFMMGHLERQTVDLFLAVSKAVAAGNGLTEDEHICQIVPNFLITNATISPIDIQRYMARLPQENYLLFVGAFRQTKGIDLLLQVHKELKGAPPLVLIGYETPGWSLPDEVSSQNVVICKNWPHEAVMAAWNRCVFGLIPSLWAEPFGLVALEAMFQGKPLVASRIGGLADIIVNGETGVLVPPGDPQALREAMQKLLDDPARQISMGRMARQKSLEFLPARIIPRIESIYREVIAQ